MLIYQVIGLWHLLNFVSHIHEPNWRYVYLFSPLSPIKYVPIFKLLAVSLLNINGQSYKKLILLLLPISISLYSLDWLVDKLIIVVILPVNSWFFIKKFSVYIRRFSVLYIPLIVLFILVIIGNSHGKAMIYSYCHIPNVIGICGFMVLLVKVSPIHLPIPMLNCVIYGSRSNMIFRIIWGSQ